MPSSVLLSKAEQELTSLSRKEFILAEKLKAIGKKYDDCVIDCPPSIGLLTFNALVASTDVIVPVQVHYYALEGLKQLLETVKLARRRFYPCSVKVRGILLTFVEAEALSQPGLRYGYPQHDKSGGSSQRRRAYFHLRSRERGRG